MRYKIVVDTNEIRIPTTNKNITISFLSDIHVSDKFDVNKFKIINDNINKNSDYIFFVGDNLDSTNFIRNNNEYMINKYYSFIKKLSIKYKIFINRSGVHDLTYRNKNRWEKDIANDFWNKISDIKGVNISGYNNFYEDDFIILFNYQTPFELFNNKYYLGEDKELLIKELNNNKKYLSNLNKNKVKIMLIHTPRLLNEIEILELIKEYDIILCGHMHNGVMPLILDKVIKGNRGIVSPNRKLFPDNARGIKEINYNGKKIYIIISGGVTKLAECSGLFNKFNNFYPISMNHLYIKK